MLQVEMTAAEIADVQDYYDNTDPLRARLWKRACESGRVIVIGEPEVA